MENNSSRTCTMSSSVNPPPVLGGVVFSKIRCYLKPGQIGGRKLFNKPKIQLVFTYNKKQKYTTKSEIVLNNDKTKKRANWAEQIYFELLSNVSTEFQVSVYNTAISGPDGRLGEASGDFKDTKKFRIEENRVTLPLMKQGEEQIGEVFFHVHLLSYEPPKSMMEKIGDSSNRAKKIGMMLINNVKFKNLAGRRGTLEVKLKDESHSTDGYWNTTTKEWRYPIALNIIANSSLDLIIQCRYTEHERASTRISLGPEGSHEHIWKSLMNGPCKVGEFSLQDQEYDSARIEFTLSCHKILTAKALFNLEDEEGESESPFLDTNQIIEEESIYHTKAGSVTTINPIVRTDTMSGRTEMLHHIGRTENGIARTESITTSGRSHTISSKSSEPNHSIPIRAIPSHMMNQQRIEKDLRYASESNQRYTSEEDSYREFSKFDSSVSGSPQSPQQFPPLPPLPQTPPSANVIGDNSTNGNRFQRPAKPNKVRTQPSQADSSIISQFPAPPMPVPPKHPLRNITIDENEPEHIRVHSSPPSSDHMIDADYENQKYKKDPSESSPSTLASPSIIPPHYRGPNSDVNVPRQYSIQSPPPPYPNLNPKQANNNPATSLRIIAQRYVIVNPLRLGNQRVRREEVSYYPQNKLYKGHHILSMLNVIIKEFSSQASWEYETTYLKDLKSRHVVKWVDMDSDPSTGEYYSITEYYGRALQLEARKFKLKKIKQVFNSICTAVNWIHSKDVVHLDLNPSNIICKEGKENHKIRICDFETSRQFGDIIQVFPAASSDAQSMQSYDTRSQYSNLQYQVFPQFTIGYTSPELLLYEDSTISHHKSDGMGIEVSAHFNQDIFSIGCILYFLYTNKALYSSLEELGDCVASERGFEYKVRKDIEDNVVVDLILKCISRNPNERPTIEDILNDEYFSEGSRGNRGRDLRERESRDGRGSRGRDLRDRDRDHESRDSRGSHGRDYRESYDGRGSRGRGRDYRDNYRDYRDSHDSRDSRDSESVDDSEEDDDERGLR